MKTRLLIFGILALSAIVSYGTANIPGDVNNDGAVTAADITALYDHLLNNDNSHLVYGDLNGDGLITAADITAVYKVMLNNQVPKDTLKVLCIGNSFTDDALSYLNSLAVAAGIDHNKLCFYLAKKSGSLDYWADVCENGDTVNINRCVGQITMPLTRAPLKELIAQDWDVITVQQLSRYSQNSATLEPALPYLVNLIRTECPNKNLVIAWMQVWSYWRKNANLQTSIENWQRINEVAQLTLDYGIDMIIPTGTAIQNARGTVLNTPHGLTRDGGHLCYGVGRYVAACSWFEALLAPVFGMSVIGNTAVHAITDYEAYYNETHNFYETVPVTDENRTLCQQCATAAIANPNQITTIE